MNTANEPQYSQLEQELDQAFVALAEIRKLVCEKLLVELKNNSISAYNAANAYASLITATSRLQSLVKEAAPVIAAPVSERESEDQKKIRKISEKMLALITTTNRPKVEQGEDQTSAVA